MVKLLGISFAAFCASTHAQLVGTGVKNGNPKYLLNDKGPGQLNSAGAKENEGQKNARLNGQVPPQDVVEEPEPNIAFNDASGPNQDPLANAKCLNKPYTVPAFTEADLNGMYNDYKIIFDWGHENPTSNPIHSQSDDNNKVTNNRFASKLWVNK
jgi:hypothetical protein